MSGNCYTPFLFRVLILPMTPFLIHLVPVIFFDCFYHISDLHIIILKLSHTSIQIKLLQGRLIGMGRHLTVPLLPHHRAYGSRTRRFVRYNPADFPIWFLTPTHKLKPKPTSRIIMPHIPFLFVSTGVCSPASLLPSVVSSASLWFSTYLTVNHLAAIKGW